MSESSRRNFPRRKFLKASVIGVGVASASCGEGESAPGNAGGGATPGMPPSQGGSQPPGMQPTGMSPTGMQPAGMQPAGPPPAPPAGPGPAPTTPPGPAGPPAAPPAMPPGMTPMPPLGPMPMTMTGDAGMPMRALGKTGQMVSIVGFGSGSQYLRASEVDAEKLIARAIELGINYFDTAGSYGNGNSERRLGKFLVPTHRNKIVLVSKCGERTAEGAKRALDLTLKNLGTDKLDIFHFHEISGGDVDRILAKGGAYEVYQRAKEQGVIRFIGLSGHSTGATLVDAMRRIKPDVMMCPQNAAREHGFTENVIPFGQQNGIGLLGMKVTAQDGLLRNGVKADELVRYSLSLPVSSMIIGMRSLAVLESCVSIAKALKPMTPPQMMDVSGKLAALDPRRCLPYRRWGYRDGLCWG